MSPDPTSPIPSDQPADASDFDRDREVKALTDSEAEPDASATSSRSGGVNVDSDTTDIGGDVTGRDKIVDQSTHGDVYNIHIEHAENVAIGRGTQVSTSPTTSESAASSTERDSLQYQLDQARENLRLIEERKAEYAQSTDIPLQLIKNERSLRERIAELERRLGLS